MPEYAQTIDCPATDRPVAKHRSLGNHPIANRQSDRLPGATLNGSVRCGCNHHCAFGNPNRTALVQTDIERGIGYAKLLQFTVLSSKIARTKQ